MREDVRAVAEDLHATSVSVFGDGVGRLAATADEAAERGLHVWLQPRLGDRPEEEILEHLAETGRHAERMRRQGARVHLSVGCEFVLFVPGIVPGADVLERIENVLNGNFDPEHMAREQARFTARAAAVGRSVFGGALTYGAAHEEDVDWSLFDIVSVNYYTYHRDPADHLRDLAAYRRWGRPVAVTEFGTCTYEGAPDQGGMGWYQVDWSKTPPEVAEGLVRSEETQARYLARQLEVFEAAQLYAMLVYNFADPDTPWSPNPRHDLDMVSYNLVRVIRDSPDTWHWEPKKGFHAVARHFGRARR
jgi:hypothetical protein